MKGTNVANMTGDGALRPTVLQSKPTATHTPGPWHVKPYGTATDMFTVYAGEGDYRPDLALIYARVMGPSNNEGAANARLIAAAPELKKALEAALPWLEKAEKDTGKTHSLNIGGPREFATEVDWDAATVALDNARAALALCSPNSAQLARQREKDSHNPFPAWNQRTP